MPANVTRTAARRAREEVIDAILVAAREQLAEVGAAALSLRRIARDLGMPSSGIYRYVESRDALLTLLIVRAYDELADAAQASLDVAAAPAVQWVDVAVAVRAWGMAHPHAWALLYGSPVPGYAAPQDTIGPGTRLSRLLMGIAEGAPLDPPPVPAVPADQAAGLSAMVAGLDVDLPGDVVVRAVAAWSQLLGLVSLEVFGQLHNSGVDLAALFARTAEHMAALIGLQPAAGEPGSPGSAAD